MGSSTFSSAVICGSRLKVWNTKAMWRSRNDASVKSRVSLVIRFSKSTRSPRVGVSMVPGAHSHSVKLEPRD